MRVEKDETGYFFDAFKHFKNNISNLIFHELPLLEEVGVNAYFNIKSVNYKSKYPDMRKIGLIDYSRTENYTLTNISKQILPFLQKNSFKLKRYNGKRLESIGEDLFESSMYKTAEYKQIANAILELELNYYDDAISIRPYFVLLKILIKNNIKLLDDNKILNILSMKKSDALQLKYIDNSFSLLDKDLQEKIKRPKSYIYDFLKTSQIINNEKKVTIDIKKISEIITKMIEINDMEENVEVNERSGRIGQNDFRNRVLKAYGYTCALTGKAISYPSKFNRGINFVLDAAHIIPYADGGSYSTNNGISLSPEIHILYDLGIITFLYNKKMELVCVVSNSESVKGGDFLNSLNGKKLTLPSDKHNWPDIDALNYKTEKYFLKAC